MSKQAHSTVHGCAGRKQTSLILRAGSSDETVVSKLVVGVSVEEED